MATGNNKALLEQNIPDLSEYEEIYKTIHRHPELGKEEKRTSTLVASRLRESGYEVTTNIGGYGVVGILKGKVDGKTVMLRADMDALPINETTGAEYSSEVEGVAHACGHDMHVTALLAASDVLVKMRDKWSGTLVIVFQPDEEHGAGAQAMINDGLYTTHNVPKPDIVLGQHLIPRKAGTLLLRPGPMLAAADTLRITIHGRGAHGSQPQHAVDPIVIAAAVIMRLQTIVARELAPSDIASITCGSIHGGSAPNVIPEKVELTLNIRTFDDKVREKVLAAIKRIVTGECTAAYPPNSNISPPDFEELSRYPLTSNDATSTTNLQQAFSDHFGHDAVSEAEMDTASEDFSNLARAVDAPYVFWRFGGVEEETWKKFEESGEQGLIKNLHQGDMAPAVQPTLRTAAEAMAVTALTFLGSKT